MNNHKYTPGPYVAENPWFDTHETYSHIYGMDGTLVRGVAKVLKTSQLSEEEFAANVELFRSAPETQDKLDKLIAACETGSLHGYGPELLRKAASTLVAYDDDLGLAEALRVMADKVEEAVKEAKGVWVK